ncbi:hypothetical protein [Streptomyces sp. T028]|uniref:hypothetical protein n=1 Tax=Streptomyces sp. T028 TaxID=3394379 RepID=UPI003A84F727
MPAARVRGADVVGWAGAPRQAVAGLREDLDIAGHTFPLTTRAVKARAELTRWRVADRRPGRVLVTTEELVGFRLAARWPDSDAVLDTRSPTADQRGWNGDALDAVTEPRTVLAVLAGPGTAPGSVAPFVGATRCGGPAARQVSPICRRLEQLPEAGGRDLANVDCQGDLPADGYAADPSRAPSARRQTGQLCVRLADIRMCTGDSAAASIEYRVLIPATTRLKDAPLCLLPAYVSFLKRPRRPAAVLLAAGRSGEVAETPRTAPDAMAGGGSDNADAAAAWPGLAFIFRVGTDISPHLALCSPVYAECPVGEFGAAVAHLAEPYARRRASSGEKARDTCAVAGVPAEWRGRRAGTTRLERRAGRDGQVGQGGCR